MLPSELIAQVRKIEIRTGRLVSETFAGQYQSVFKGRGMEFAEVREYVPGDDVRSIDWNVTARLGKPYVKRYMEERELTAFFCCDLSGSQYFGSRSKLKQEIAAELSALLALSALKNNDKVGLAIITDRVELFIPPKKGRYHALRLIRELLAFTPAHPRTSIGPCLDVLNRMLGRHSIFFLISDFLDQNYEMALKRTAKKHDLVPILLQDPKERQLPEIPAWVEVEDPETGSRTVFSGRSRNLAQAFRRHQEEQTKRVRRLFAVSGIDHISIDTGGSYIDPVVRFFRARAKKFR